MPAASRSFVEPDTDLLRRPTMILITAFGLAGLAAAPADKSMPTMESVSINASDIKWGEAPPGLPKGAQAAVLHGDPSKKAPFTVRLKMPSGYKIPAHWHSQDEQLTILAGTFVLRLGDSPDAAPHELAAGAFHFLPGKMHHAAEARGEVVLQVDGTGPFDITYVNATDDPRRASK
jgi:hypothetical protein